MKHFLLATTFLAATILLALPSCQKDSTTTPNIVKDTTSVKDTTAVVKDTIKPPVKGKNIAILVREAGSLRPAANCPVNLFRQYTISYPSTRKVYERYDSLGRTDAQGKLVWHWKGDSLPQNIYLGFDNGIYDGNEKYTLYTGPIPGDYYEGFVLSRGVVRLRIEIKKASLPFPGIEVVQYKTGGYYQQTPNWDGKASFKVPKLPYDTTIMLSDIAPATFSYGIRYGVDNSSYQSYISSAKSTEPFAVTFKARDTTDQHIIIQ